MAVPEKYSPGAMKYFAKLSTLLLSTWNPFLLFSTFKEVQTLPSSWETNAILRYNQRWQILPTFILLSMKQLQS